MASSDELRKDGWLYFKQDPQLGEIRGLDPWAVENGITTGTAEGTFSPDATCTRAQIVAFLWRAAGRPAPKSTEMPFTDVKKGCYYYNAVQWAVENGITSGTSATTFQPLADCTRAQIVTFLYRCLAG